MKKWFKLFGALVFFAGCFMLLGSELIMTGNVISEKTGNLTSILSIIVIIGGILVMSWRKDSEDLEYKVAPIENIFQKVDRSWRKDNLFVLDASGAIDYEEVIEKLIKRYPQGVIVPYEVMDELKPNKRLTEKIKSKTTLSNHLLYGKWLKMSKDVLVKTPKHKEYLILKDILDGKINPEKETRNFITPYFDRMKKIVYSLSKKKKRVPSQEEIQTELVKRYKIGKGDVDVLATALDQARRRKNVWILGEDRHLEQAVDILKEKYKGISKFLNYVQYRDYKGLDFA